MELKFEIIKNLLTLPSKTTFHKELNVIKWNSGENRIDLRGWNEDHTKCTKGVTLTDEELRALVEVLQGGNIVG